MAKNLYKAYISGGEASGKYTSSLRDIDSIYDNINLTGQKFAIQRAETSNILDSLQAGIELAGTIAGSMQSKKKFETESMPAAQKMLAKKAYDPKEYGDMSYADFQKTDDFKDYFESFAPKKVEMSLFESLFAEEPMYTIGDETFKKSDISFMGQLDKSQRLSKLTGVDIQDIINVKQDMYSETQSNIIDDANTDITLAKIQNKVDKTNKVDSDDNVLKRGNQFLSGEISFDDFIFGPKDENE